ERRERRVRQFAEDYNADLSRWRRWIRDQRGEVPRGQELIKKIDDFVNYEKIKWSRNLKRAFRQNIEIAHDPRAVRISSYRPFTSKALHFQRTFVDEVGTIADFLPSLTTERDNILLLVPAAGARSPFWCFAS